MQFCEILTVKPTGCIIVKLQNTNAVVKVFLNHRIPIALYKASITQPISSSIMLGMFHKESMSWVHCILSYETPELEPTRPEDERTVYQRTPRKRVF